MASGSEDEQQGAWYFRSDSYVPESSSESEEEPHNMEEIRPQQQNQHKPRLTNELRQLIFQEMLSLKVSDSLPHGTFKRIAQKYGYTHRSMLIQQLIPAMLRKWPSEGPSIIFIQQDNARVHITNDDPIWQQHNRQGGLTFILIEQPLNSSDCNILDLGFFRGIQSLIHKKMPKT